MSKIFPFGAHIAFTILLLSSAAMSGCDGLQTDPFPSSSHSREQAGVNGDHIDNVAKEKMKEEVGAELFPMGSSLPDCSHACGPCVPCKRVIVSYRCSAESCPVVYRCMCKGKYYHVPSH
ncbi:protein EPIDERMAL PATTERNING FACTOR 2-like [Rhodamnia argentea]|uniref:Epidermal patterning factor-like protein n=1 Tax=Rhodamnia argentea TaxID=178133 RepID=A0ABM3H2A5_9MYRT|nr:protein EPIDERMAL PATTERNING FACTOR 2-like [Rhodamnia argentea]